MVKSIWEKVKRYASVVGALALVALSTLSAPLTYAQTPEFDVDAGSAIMTDAVGTFGSFLVSTLPAVFGILAILIGVFFVWRQISKRIGRAK